MTITEHATPKTTSSVSKKNLFSGHAFKKSYPMRPPWAVDESLFDDTCTNCGDCITACPQGILIFARGKLPIVDFSLGGCTFCGDCESNCKDNALIKIDQHQPWMLKALITETCLAKQKVTCRSCEDPCEVDAIRFKLALGGLAIPEIQTENCTGCGACLGSCPTQSISININQLKD